MAIYVVLSEANNTPLRDKIAAAYPNGGSYRINDQQWLLVSEQDAKDVGDGLGLSEGELGGVAIFRVGAPYWGWHEKALWEWVALKFPIA
jgi:hypothetical protein